MVNVYKGVEERLDVFAKLVVVIRTAAESLELLAVGLKKDTEKRKEGVEVLDEDLVVL